MLERLGALVTGQDTTTGDELDAGAQLVTTDPDGTEVFRASLARHWRIDADDPHLIWIRPILGGYEEHGAPAFNLSLARPRGLSYADARLEGDDVVLHLLNEQTARIQPATGPQLAELERWDTFYHWVLTEQETAELDQLQADSWHGRFA